MDGFCGVPVLISILLFSLSIVWIEAFVCAGNATAVVGSFNIVFVKGHKVGGSTVGGVVRRIGQHYNLSGSSDALFISREPGIWANHRLLAKLHPSLLMLQLPMFKMSWVRNPIDRAMSMFYHFEVSRKNESTAAANKLNYLSTQPENSQTRYLTPLCDDQQQSPQQCITDYYDFIGLTERFDESMVLLAQRLNLTLCDILYLKAKDSHSGGVDDIGATFVPHQELQEEPAAVRQFLLGGDFALKNTDDWQLVRAVNDSISAAIHRLGEEIFAGAVDAYRGVLQAAAHLCSGQISDDNCYWNDNGCGYRCLDHICMASPSTTNLTFPFNKTLYFTQFPALWDSIVEASALD